MERKARAQRNRSRPSSGGPTCPKCDCNFNTRACDGPGCLILIAFILCVEAFAVFIMIIAINPVADPFTATMVANEASYNGIKPLFETISFAKVALGMSSFFSGVIGCFNTIVFLSSTCMKNNCCLCMFLLWPVFICCWATAGTITGFVGLS